MPKKKNPKKNGSAQAEHSIATLAGGIHSELLRLDTAGGHSTGLSVEKASDIKGVIIGLAAMGHDDLATEIEATSRVFSQRAREYRDCQLVFDQDPNEDTCKILESAERKLEQALTTLAGQMQAVGIFLDGVEQHGLYMYRFSHTRTQEIVDLLNGSGTASLNGTDTGDESAVKSLLAQLAQSEQQNNQSMYKNVDMSRNAVVRSLRKLRILGLLIRKREGQISESTTPLDMFIDTFSSLFIFSNDPVLSDSKDMPVLALQDELEQEENRRLLRKMGLQLATQIEEYGIDSTVLQQFLLKLDLEEYDSDGAVIRSDGMEFYWDVLALFERLRSKQRAEKLVQQQAAPIILPDAVPTGKLGPTGEESVPTHSSDFTSVDWYGMRYTFAKGNQAHAVRILWEAYEAGNHSLCQETIGESIGSAAGRFDLRKTFRRRKQGGGYEQHPAWGTMICEAGKGVYCLVPLDSG